MKIRGNTVGTTLSPKAALIKCENLTEEEKAIARHNIGAAGGAKYFTTLIDALDAVHSGVYDAALTVADGAVARVDIGDTRATLTLLQSIEHQDQLIFAADMDLILNGHTLSMSYAGDNITVNAGASLFIDGTKDCSAVLADAQSKAAVLIKAYGALSVKGGQYSITNGVGTTAAFVSTDVCPVLTIRECMIHVENSTSSSAVGIQSQADKLEICDVEITTDGYKATAVQHDSKTSISNLSINSTATHTSNGIVAFLGSTTTANGVRISAESPAGEAYGLMIQAGAAFTVENLNVFAATKAEKAKNKDAYGVFNKGTCSIENSVILADAVGLHTEDSMSVGINNTGSMVCRNVNSFSTHAGLVNTGDLHVDRCLISGVSHGGLYTLHPNAKKVVVNDTVLEAGVYRGRYFTDVFLPLFTSTSPTGINVYSAMYFGSTNFADDGGNVYMDSCIFVGLANEAFVVRPAAYTEDGLNPEKNPNRLYISRSKIAVQKTYSAKGQIPTIRLNRGDGGVLLQHAFAELFIGSGCNFTVDNVQLSADATAYVHNDEVLYREKDQHLPTYEEYYALMKEATT